MRRRMMALAAAGAIAAGLPGCGGGTMAQSEAQALVDRSTLTVQDMLVADDPNQQANAVSLLRRARAVVVCPRVFRAGFVFGGQGGDCVLTARDGAGSWSSPAFYTIGSASFGLQIGLQDAQVMMLILTDRGLNAVMDSQVKLGADASVAVATVGAGIAGATTTAVGADIVGYARSRGLYAGLTLEGSLLSSRSDFNAAYYGRPLGTREIVVAMQAHNPASDPLRAALMQHGGAAPAGPPPMAQGGLPPVQAAPTGAVTRETLR